MSNRHKALLLLGASMWLSVGLSRAQSIVPQSVNSAGTKMTQANGSLSYTVGELVALTFVDSNGNTLGSGFPSGSTTSTISVVTILEPRAEWFDVKVYPNPTSDLLTFTIPDIEIPKLTLEATDISGRKILTKEFTDGSASLNINTASWPSGMYIINLKKNNNQLIGSYKITKQ